MTANIGLLVCSQDAVRLAALQQQVDELEARQEAREAALQAVLRDVQQSSAKLPLLPPLPPQERDDKQGASCKPNCPAALRLLHKNRDLCFYRAEMDRLLEALRDLQRARGAARDAARDAARGGNS